MVWGSRFSGGGGRGRGDGREDKVKGVGWGIGCRLEGLCFGVDGLGFIV